TLFHGVASAQGLAARELEIARKSVDPSGKLTELQRTLAALGTVYQYWANKGVPQNAQRIAAQIVPYYRLAVHRYAAISTHAKQTDGSTNPAAIAALKAYTHLPDGRDGRITYDGEKDLVVYHYLDANGVISSKVIPTPQRFASSAMGLVANGFDEALIAAAH